MADIFISYRRDDSGGHAGRLYDHLSQRFGRGRVFMDIDAIPPGVDFAAEIDRVLRRCAVVLVVIGRRWVESMGQWRQTDYLKAEIIAALGRGAGIRVVPVLVDGAVLPDQFKLSADLRPLLTRHAFHISDRSFAHDTNKLIESISRVVKSRSPAGPRSKAPRAAGATSQSGGATPAKTKTRRKGAAEASTPGPRPTSRSRADAEGERAVDKARSSTRKKSGGQGPVAAKPPRQKAAVDSQQRKTSPGKSPGSTKTGSPARPPAAKSPGGTGKASTGRRSASNTPPKQSVKSRPASSGAKTTPRKPAADRPRKKR